LSSKSQQKAKPRLGRGLSSLISIPEVPVKVELPSPPDIETGQAVANTEAANTPGDTPPAATQAASQGETGPAYIAVGAIVPNPHQPRQVFDDHSLADLAASIKSSGLIQPIIVRKVGGQYQLIAGERRLRAAKIAGLSTIPVLIRDVDAVTQAQMALIENIQREDLNPIDRAQGYRTLIDQLGLTQGELAGRLGEDRSSIANFLRLLDLAENVKAMVRDGRLSVGHAKLIASVADPLEQERLANLCVLQGLSVRNLERVMKERPKAPAPQADNSQSAYLQDLEKNLSRQLGLRVQVKAASKKGKGRLVVHYGSLDQFDELLTRLGVSAE
jgi:ParB family chromosome partitioning protein